MSRVYTSRRRRRIGLAEFYPFSSARQFIAAKRDAGRHVQRALSTGALVRCPCTECGAKKSEAHHDDYDKPLDVLWLCRFHHRRRDADLRMARRAQTKREALSALPLAYLKRQARLQTAPFAITSKPRRSLVASRCTIAIVTQATSAFADLLDAERVSESQLAKRMRCSRQLLNAQFAGGFRTLKVLAAYADALGYEASVVFRKRVVSAEVAS